MRQFPLFLIAAACLYGQVGKESQACMACHQGSSPGIVGQWKQSKHAGASVGCFECHQAEKGDKDGYEHNGFFIATIVSPKDCSQCH